MTIEAWMTAWGELQAVMDSENGEELMPWAHAQAVLLCRSMPPLKDLQAYRAAGGQPPMSYPDLNTMRTILLWRRQTGRSCWLLKEHRHLNRKPIPCK